MSLKNTIDKITALKELIETLESNCENRFYYSDKKNSTLNRADEKIEELVHINHSSEIIINSRDKSFQVSMSMIKNCPFRTYLLESVEKGHTKEIFVDIGNKYLKYALELMRKAITRTTMKFQRKIRLLIYPKDHITPMTFIDFLLFFFTNLDQKELFENFELMHVPKKVEFNYSVPVESIKFLTEKEIEKMVNSSNKNQINKEKKQNVDRKDIIVKDSFFVMKKDDEVNYLSSVFNEKVEFEKTQ